MCPPLPPPKRTTFAPYVNMHESIQSCNTSVSDSSSVKLRLRQLGLGSRSCHTSSSGAVITQRHSAERLCSTTQPSNAEQLLGCDSGPSPSMVVRPRVMPYVPAQESCCGMGQPGLQGGQSPRTHILPWRTSMELLIEMCLPLQPTFTHPPHLKPPSEHSYSSGTIFTLEMHTVCIQVIALNKNYIHRYRKSCRTKP